MWVLYGKCKVTGMLLDYYKTVRIPFHSRSDAVKESRYYWNMYHKDWIPKTIQWEPK